MHRQEAEELWVLKCVTVCTRTVAGISMREIPTSFTASTTNWTEQNFTVPRASYEGWDFNSGNYLFSTDTK